MAAFTGQEYTAALLVINSSQRMTDEIKNMITLCRIFFNSDDRIIPVFTRAGSTAK
jgi:hypothetical protein